MEQTNKRRALGRGLEELFNNEPIDYSQIEEKIVHSTPKEEITEINLTELRSNPYQPRKHFDQKALEELAVSIKEYGVVQPIIVKKSIKGYEIIAGERRAKASIIAGKETIPAIIRDFTEEEMMEIALLENLQRENLNAIEEASAYQKLILTLKITQEQLADRVGKSRSHITNMLGLLSLPNSVKKAVAENKITMGHARVLSKIEDTETIENLLKQIEKDSLSVRDLENLTTGEEYKRKKVQKKSAQKTNEYVYVENLLTEKYGTKVKIKNNKIELSFANVNDLNRLLEIMNINN